MAVDVDWRVCGSRGGTLAAHLSAGGGHWLPMWICVVYTWQSDSRGTLDPNGQLAVGIGCRCGFACIRGSCGAHWVLTWHVHSAGGGGDSDELAPGRVSHIMGLPFVISYATHNPPPTPEPSETQKEAYIPRWRGEARW